MADSFLKALRRNMATGFPKYQLFKAMLGYSGGSAVTQLTSKATGVTINAESGQITCNNAQLNAGVEVTFTVTNNRVKSTDVPLVALQSVFTSGAYLATVSAVADGSFDITLTNASGGALSEAGVINFVLMGGSAS